MVAALSSLGETSAWKAMTTVVTDRDIGCAHAMGKGFAQAIDVPCANGWPRPYSSPALRASCRACGRLLTDSLS